MTSEKTLSNKLLDFFLIIFLSIFTLIGCGERNDQKQLERIVLARSDQNINQSLLKRLKTDRIVMLSDGEHGQRLYFQKLIALLNHWVDDMEAQNRENPTQISPPDLTLILEMDSLEIGKINEGMKIDDYFGIIEPTFIAGGIFTTAYLEFYHDLGILKKRVDELNKSAGMSAKIRFNFYGPERPIDINRDNWSLGKRDSFFLYERDEYSSQKVIDLLDRNPDTKALIYYGPGHLEKNRTFKIASVPKVRGYFIAHYLTDHFAKKGGIGLIDQIPLTVMVKYCGETFAKPGSSYIIDNSVIKRIPEVGRKWRHTDATIVWFEEAFAPKNIQWVWSERIVGMIFEHLDEYRNINNEFDVMTLGPLFQYLYIISGRKFMGIDFKNQAAVDNEILKWKTWFRTARLDVVAGIEKLSYWKQLISLMNDTTDFEKWDHYERILYRAAGFQPIQIEGLSEIELADKYSKKLQANRKRLVVENLVHMLWVASDPEKKKAFAVLSRETGKDFKTAKEWTVWWYETGKKEMPMIN